MQSASLGLSIGGGHGHWVFETPNEKVAGTRLRLRVLRRGGTSLTELFDRYCPQPELRFARTEVALLLMQQIDGALVSRSQGKRLVMGLERFEVVQLDLTGVQGMQQGFADEVFRVWAQAHPAVRIEVTGADDAARRMLARVGCSA